MKTFNSKSTFKILASILLALVLTVGLGYTVLAQGGNSETTILVTDSDSNALPHVSISYHNGYWRGLGETGADGKLTTDAVPDGDWTFKASYGGTSQQESGTAGDTINFQTSKATAHVTKSDSSDLQGASVSYHAGYWRGIGETGGDGKVLVELFPGTYDFKASYGGTSDTKSLTLDADGETVAFQTSKATAHVTKSDSSDLQGASVSYHAGYWRGIGETDGDGKVSAELFPGTYDFKASYGGTSDTESLTLDADGETIAFQTVQAKAYVRDCDNPISGVSVSYHAGYWRGIGKTDSDGEASVELFPTGDLKFKASYGGTSDTETMDLDDDGETVEFIITKVNLSYGGSMAYHAGYWRGFNGPIFMFPGTYKFKFDGYQTMLDIAGCEMDGIVIVRLHNDDEPLDPPGYYLECPGLGNLTNGQLLLIDETTLKCRAHAGNITGPWFYWKTVNNLLDYNFATVHVTLFNDANGEEGIQDADKLGGAFVPGYQVEIAGVGKKTTSDTFHVPHNASIKYRLRTANITGPWQYQKFTPGHNEWELEFATVHVTLFNDANGEEGIQDADKLGGAFVPGYQVEISGVGKKTTSDTFHVPPNTSIKYRLRTANIVGPWQYQEFDAGENEWGLEFATVHVTLYNDANGEEGIQDEDKLGGAFVPGYQVEISGVGKKTTSDTFHVPPNTSIKYRLRTADIVGPWQYQKFDAGENVWELEFATVTVFLHNNNVELEAGYQVEVSGVGKMGSGSVFHVPPNTSIKYRLRTENITGPWQYQKFAAGENEWDLEFATVTVFLHNNNVELEAGYQVEVSGVGKMGSGSVFHVPPNTSIKYRLRTENITGPWQYHKFGAGEAEWKLEFATVSVIIDGPGAVDVSNLGGFTDGDIFHVPPDANLKYRLQCCDDYQKWAYISFPAGDQNWNLACPLTVLLFNDDEELEDPHKVQISGSGDYTTGDEIPWDDVPGRGRLHRAGVYGAWFDVDPADDDGTDACMLELEFATVHVTLYNDTNGNGKIDDGETLGDNHKVQVSGVGDFANSETFHVPPTAKLSYRLHTGGVYGEWHQDQTFDASENEWKLEFATVHVTLYNDSDEDGEIEQTELLDAPHKVQVSGIGDFTTSNTFHVPPTAKLSYRLHTGGVYGAWHNNQSFPAGYTDWQVEFATVHVTLYNDSNENDQIEDNEKLDDPHKVQVSGIGDFTTSNTFHAPPTAQLRYRLHTGGVYGAWHGGQSFPAGYTDWQVEFATVHVMLYNDSDEDGEIEQTELLDAPHKVQVSGIGDFTTSNTFHAPPTAKLSYRLHTGGVYGAWHNNQSFPAGYTDWQVEFATVHVTLLSGITVLCDPTLETGCVDYKPQPVIGPYRVQVSGIGDFTTSNIFHVPPTAKLSYRLHNGGVYGAWHSDQSFPAGYTEWELEFGDLVEKGTLTIVKDAMPDAGWLTWTFSGDLGDFTLDNAMDDAAYPDRVTFEDVLVGSYEVYETNRPGNWDLEIVCESEEDSEFTLVDPDGVSIDLAAGDDVVCTFVNERRGQVRVIKYEDLNGNGERDEGEPELPGWQVWLYASPSGNGDDWVLKHIHNDHFTPHSFNGLLPGLYLICKEYRAGWENTDPGETVVEYEGKLCQTVEVDYADALKVQFGNTAKGSLTIIKEATPEGKETFTFAGDLDVFTLVDDGSDANQVTFPDLTPGVYEVTEAVTGKWSLLSVMCQVDGMEAAYEPVLDDNDVLIGVDVTVGSGQEVVCTFTNEKPDAVELAEVEAMADGGVVTMRWRTLSEMETVGFNVMRSTTAEGLFEQVNGGLIVARGEGLGGASYEFVDQAVEAGVTYYYYVQEVLATGGVVDYPEWTVSSTVGGAKLGGVTYTVYLPLVQRK